jgi:hypothetical protein
MGLVLFLVVSFLYIATQILIDPVVEVFLERVWKWTGHVTPSKNIFLMLIAQLMFLIITLVVAAGRLRLVPAFHRQVLQEWTLLSFLLYGIAVLPVIANDEYAGMRMYQTASLLVLIVGMVICLRALMAPAAGIGVDHSGSSSTNADWFRPLPQVSNAARGRTHECIVPDLGVAATGILPSTPAYSAHRGSTGSSTALG